MRSKLSDRQRMHVNARILRGPQRGAGVVSQRGTGRRDQYGRHKVVEMEMTHQSVGRAEKEWEGESYIYREWDLSPATGYNGGRMSMGWSSRGGIDAMEGEGGEGGARGADGELTFIQVQPPEEWSGSNPSGPPWEEKSVTGTEAVAQVRIEK